MMHVWLKQFVVGVVFLATLTGCSGSENAPASAATPASPVSTAPSAPAADIHLKINPKGDALVFDVGGEPRTFTLQQLFDDRATRIEDVKLMGQEITSSRTDLMLRVESHSLAQKGDALCASGREVVALIYAEDTDTGNQGSQVNVLESCKQRIRIVSQRQNPQGVLEIEQEQSNGQSSPWGIHLMLDTRHPGSSIGL
ncbi:hypothetical protein [Dyella japonica]|uniref:Uncharacterized protein n=1 Tax=Dyella japonica TaxID=231455 RepID=A0ABV2JSK3_9GAMM